ncbi:hypothetical protein Anapl_07059 [Anas platyrhynchos]|uniref:Uncharacterized protein n=1 Tax=Anas platyrhynchos TaxID=8839 RepID=R0L4U9_ANAPL|nr:hypothetical protein Anapl_07059 [Anas platyrhynchos]
MRMCSSCPGRAQALPSSCCSAEAAEVSSTSCLPDPFTSSSRGALSSARPHCSFCGRSLPCEVTMVVKNLGKMRPQHLQLSESCACCCCVLPVLGEPSSVWKGSPGPGQPPALFCLFCPPKAFFNRTAAGCTYGAVCRGAAGLCPSPQDARGAGFTLQCRCCHPCWTSPCSARGQCLGCICLILAPLGFQADSALASDTVVGLCSLWRCALCFSSVSGVLEVSGHSLVGTSYGAVSARCLRDLVPPDATQSNQLTVHQW